MRNVNDNINNKIQKENDLLENRQGNAHKIYENQNKIDIYSIEWMIIKYNDIENGNNKYLN